MPSRMPWAADLEDGVHAEPEDRPVDERRAGLVRGDLVVHRVRADQLADQLAPRAGRPDAADPDLAGEIPLDLAQALADRLDGPRLGPEIDLLEDVAVGVEHGEVR